MDIFKQKRILVITIIILVILNVASLLVLWLGKPDRHWDRNRDMPFRRTERIEKLLKKELGFNDVQAKKYISLRKEHGEKTKLLNKDLRELKRQMFAEAITINMVRDDDPDYRYSQSLSRRKKTSKRANDRK